MPLDYSVHALGNPVQGNHPPMPHAMALAQQTGLAENADSLDIVVTHASAILCCTATLKLRIDIEPLGTALAPAASGIVLNADQMRMFTLHRGTWRLRTVAYA